MNSIPKFLSEVRSELGKVVWPGYDDFVGSTIIVLIVVVAFSFYFGVVDTVLGKIRELIF